MRYKLLFFALFIFLCACATRSEIIQDNLRRDFRSSKQPIDLAHCIDRCADENIANALQSKITIIGGQPIEVLIRDGHTVRAVVKIEALDGGSNAIFYLGGLGFWFPDTVVKELTKGCE